MTENEKIKLQNRIEQKKAMTSLSNRIEGSKKQGAALLIRAMCGSS